jgi:hypothetical protein
MIYLPNTGCPDSKSLRLWKLKLLVARFVVTFRIHNKKKRKKKDWIDHIWSVSIILGHWVFWKLCCEKYLIMINVVILGSIYISRQIEALRSFEHYIMCTTKDHNILSFLSSTSIEHTNNIPIIPFQLRH